MKKKLLLLTVLFTITIVKAQVTGSQTYSEIFDGAPTNWTNDRAGSASVDDDGHFVKIEAGTGRSDIAYNLSANPTNETDAGINANELTFDTTFDKYIAVKFIGNGPTATFQGLTYSADGGWTAKPSPTGTYTTAAGNQIQYWDLAALLGSAYDPVNNLSFKVRRLQLISQGFDYSVDWIATFATVQDIETNAAVADDGVEDNDENVLSVTSLESTDLVVYPNPTKGLVSFNTSKSLNADLTVYNLFGKIVLTKPVSDLENQVDISNLASGMYLFKVESKEGVLTKRVIKQ